MEDWQKSGRRCPKCGSKDTYWQDVQDFWETCLGCIFIGIWVLCMVSIVLIPLALLMVLVWGQLEKGKANYREIRCRQCGYVFGREEGSLSGLPGYPTKSQEELLADWWG